MPTNANGNCAYYGYQAGLFDNNILFPLSVTEMRRELYELGISLHKKGQLLNKIVMGNGEANATFKGNIIERLEKIYKDGKNFDYGCRKPYWFDAGLVLPLLCLRYEKSFVTYNPASTRKSQMCCLLSP